MNVGPEADVAEAAPVNISLLFLFGSFSGFIPSIKLLSDVDCCIAPLCSLNPALLTPFLVDLFSFSLDYI